MNYSTFTIALLPEEIALADAISFDAASLRGDPQAFKANADTAFRLTKLLLAREAIPEYRIRYFTDAAFHPGGRGASRKAAFERHGAKGDDILRHGNFLPYLRYFIHGTDLPPAIVQAFTRAVADCGSISSGDLMPLGATARRLARAHRLDGRWAAEEYYKLCLDLGMTAMSAASIRSLVRQLRL